MENPPTNRKQQGADPAVPNREDVNQIAPEQHDRAEHLRAGLLARDNRRSPSHRSFGSGLLIDRFTSLTAARPRRIYTDFPTPGGDVRNYTDFDSVTLCRGGKNAVDIFRRAMSADE